MSTHTHDELCDIAARFLKRNGFGVVFHDKFRAITHNGEQPDCLGFRTGTSCLIECKTSRADFIADRKKKFRIAPELGMGNFRFMMTPENLITVDELPANWGLLTVSKAGRVKKVHGWPANTGWHDHPFHASKACEVDYLYSACRRMEIRGHLKEVYEGLPNVAFR